MLCIMKSILFTSEPDESLDAPPDAMPQSAPRPGRLPASTRFTLVAWIDDPKRDPGALLVRIAKVMVGISARWEALIVHDPALVPMGDRLAPWLRAPGVRLVAMPAGTSAGAGVREALRLAQGDVALVMDAAMQRSPEVLHDVVQGWTDGADVVRLCAIPDAVVSAWPSTARFRAWFTTRGLNAAWLGGVRLLGRPVLDALLAASRTGVPEFTVWTVLTQPERVVHPWGTIATSAESPVPSTPLHQRVLAWWHHKARVLFSASTALSGVGFALTRMLIAHPVGRWAAVAALLAASAMPLVFDDDAVINSKSGERPGRAMQVSGSGLVDDLSG